MTIRYLSAGESHGPSLTAIVEGFWSNVPIDLDSLNNELAKRQLGYGRGGRMKIEKDKLQILSGIRHGITTGSPISLQINNKDFQNWKDQMSPEPCECDEQSSYDNKLTRPRPGHADLSGGIKYRHDDLRNTLERSSARETAIRTGVGALCKQLLAQLNISIYGYVTGIGNVKMTDEQRQFVISSLTSDNLYSIKEKIESSSVRCPEPDTTDQMKQEIDKFWKVGDTVGGEFELVAVNVPVGLGSHVHYDRKLDSNLTAAVMSLQGIKGVEVGSGFEAAGLPGSQVHDEINYDDQNGYYRKSNNAGGIEGGMSNGEPLIIRAAMKPIPTLAKPLNSVDIESKKPFTAQVERSDACAVPAASVVAENIMAFELVREIKEKYGGDSLGELWKNYGMV